jgi:hypothetical protein
MILPHNGHRERLSQISRSNLLGAGDSGNKALLEPISPHENRSGHDADKQG